MLMFFQSIVYQTHTHTHRQRRSHVWSDTFNGHFVFEDNSIAYSNSNNTKTITTSAVTCCMFRVLYDVCNWSSHGNGKWENRILEMTNFRETDFVHTERESTHSMHIARIYTLYSMYAHVHIYRIRVHTASLSARTFCVACERPMGGWHSKYVHKSDTIDQNNSHCRLSQKQCCQLLRIKTCCF